MMRLHEIACIRSSCSHTDKKNQHLLVVGIGMVPGAAGKISSNLPDEPNELGQHFKVN